MKWDRIIYAAARPGEDLSSQIDALIQYQRKNWKLFREGEEALASMKTKVFSEGDAHILVQVNPGRCKSTHAKVDPESVAKRPCFLCAENIPADERGIAFEDLVILPNPYPVLRRHFTIPSREHRPQRLEGRVSSMLELAKAMGPDMMVFYNGPACGASAPDHFHFQACSSVGVPLLDDLSPSAEKTAYTSFGRRLLVHNHRDAGKADEYVRQVLAALSTGEEEPLINVLAVFKDERYQTVLWPRGKHRPDCYFKEGDERVAVSPAALEMAGILVVAEPDHFDRVDQETAVSIYEEVSLDAEQFDRLKKAVS
jgi:hypothetical protein